MLTFKWLLSGRSRPSDNGGFGHPDPEIREGGGRSQINFFQPFGPQFGLKNKGVPAPPPPAPFPRSPLLLMRDPTEPVKEETGHFPTSLILLA